MNRWRRNCKVYIYLYVPLVFTLRTGPIYAIRVPPSQPFNHLGALTQSAYLGSTPLCGFQPGDVSAAYCTHPPGVVRCPNPLCRKTHLTHISINTRISTQRRKGSGITAGASCAVFWSWNQCYMVLVNICYTHIPCLCDTSPLRSYDLHLHYPRQGSLTIACRSSAVSWSWNQCWALQINICAIYTFLVYVTLLH